MIRSKYKVYKMYDGYRYPKRELYLEVYSRKIAKEIVEALNKGDSCYGDYEWAGFVFG